MSTINTLLHVCLSIYNTVLHNTTSSCIRIISSYLAVERTKDPSQDYTVHFLSIIQFNAFEEHSHFGGVILKLCLKISPTTG